MALNRWVAVVGLFGAHAAVACCFAPERPASLLRIPSAPYRGHVLHGVVLPDFAPRHLALLYRSASGVPVSELELAALEQEWPRIYGVSTSEADADKAREAWSVAAAKVLGTPVPTKPPQSDGADYAGYLRVAPDAYVQASARLAVRTTRYAKQPELLKAWVHRQSAALGDPLPGAPEAMPTPPPALAALWKKDLAHLDAIQAFYEGRFDDAVRGFEQLEGDEAKWGPYLAARTVVRQASFLEGDARAAKLADGEKRLRAIKTKDEAVSGATNAMLLRVLRLRGSPLCEVVAKTMEPKLGGLLPHVLAAVEETDCPAPAPLREWLKVFSTLEVTGWTQQQRTPQGRHAARTAIEKWSATKSRAWLVAALTAAEGDEAELPQLLEAAKAIPPGDIIAATVAIHEVRLLRRSGRLDLARARLTELPWPTWSQGAQAYFRLERGLLATSARAAVDDVWLPTVATWQENLPEFSSRFGDASYLRRSFDGWVDSGELMTLSADASLPMPLRQALAWSAFARRALVNGDVVAPAKAVLAVDASETALKEIIAAADAPTRRGLTLALLMKRPGVSALVLDEGEAKTKGIATRAYERYGCASIRNGWFPSKPEGAAPTWASPNAAAERAVISEGSGVAYAKVALAFSTEFPKHALAPELLHRAVLHGKYTSGGNEAKAAFQKLHKNYGGSKWAKETPVHW